MLRTFCCPVVALALLAPAAFGDVGNFSLKTVDAPAPKELKEDIQKLLDGKALQVSAGGNLLAEVWLRKQVPAKAADNVSYNSVAESTILGAIRIPNDWTDYRDQELKPGVYTLRLGNQPQDGDHMGTAPQPTFVVLVAAKVDPKADPMEVKEMVQRSAFGLGRSHPGVLLLFPVDPKTAAEPTLVSRPGDHTVLATRVPVEVNGQAGQGYLGLGLTVGGHANE